MLRSKNFCEFAIHFNKFPHALKDISFTVIEQTENTTDDLNRILLTQEGYWAEQLRTLQPFGLNKHCEFLSKKQVNYKC